MERVARLGVSKKLPYFCWYPADFDVDENVKLMNIEEVGLYAICLNHSWVNGSLPAEPLEIARAMKVPKAQFLRAWPRVVPCFAKREDGRWTNPRQERERETARRSQEAKQEGGRKTAAKRWGSNSLDDSLAITRVSGSGCDVGSEDLKEKKDAPPLYSRFHDLLAAWPNPTGVDLGMQIWMQLVDDRTITEETLPEIMEGLERWKISAQWLEKRMFPKISNWLLEKKWKDHPVQARSFGMASGY